MIIKPKESNLIHNSAASEVSCVGLRTIQVSSFVFSIFFAWLLSSHPAKAEANQNQPVEVTLDNRIGQLEEQLRSLASAGGDDTTKIEAFLHDPARVIDLAKNYIEAEKFEAAYCLLRSIQLLQTDLDPEIELKACQYAASIAGMLYRMERFRSPKSTWVVTEPEATFQWICSLEGMSAEAYQELLQIVFVGVPMPYWERFMAFRELHFAGKTPVPVDVEVDNGRVEKLIFE